LAGFTWLDDIIDKAIMLGVKVEMTIIKYDLKKKLIKSCFNTDLKRTLVVQQP